MANFDLNPLDDLLQPFNPPVPASDDPLTSSTSTLSNTTKSVEIADETTRPYHKPLEAAPLQKPVVSIKQGYYEDILTFL